MNDMSMAKAAMVLANELATELKHPYCVENTAWLSKGNTRLNGLSSM